MTSTKLIDIGEQCKQEIRKYILPICFLSRDNQLKSICRKIRVQLIKNDRLDEEIEALNLDVNEQHQLHDADLEDQISKDI